MVQIYFSVLFSAIVFREKLSKKAAIGLLLMVLGTLAMAIRA